LFHAGSFDETQSRSTRASGLSGKPDFNKHSPPTPGRGVIAVKIVGSDERREPTTRGLLAVRPPAGFALQREALGSAQFEGGWKDNTVETGQAWAKPVRARRQPAGKGQRTSRKPHASNKYR
jgi:hypothetical protein